MHRYHDCSVKVEPIKPNSFRNGKTVPKTIRLTEKFWWFSLVSFIHKFPSTVRIQPKYAPFESAHFSNAIPVYLFIYLLTWVRKVRLNGTNQE